jgi:hypothetical protein
MGHFAGFNDFKGLSGRVRQILRIMPRLLRLYGPQAWPLPPSRKGARRFLSERLCAVGLVTRTGRKGDTAPRMARLIQSVAREVFAGSIIFESV